MRNDARPFGEALRHDHDVDRRERDEDRAGTTAAREQIRDDKRFVTDRDPGDEETAMPAPDATLRTKI